MAPSMVHNKAFRIITWQENVKIPKGIELVLVLSLALDTKKAAINQLLSVRLTIIQNVCARVRLDRNVILN
jgi:hypothetical protein